MQKELEDALKNGNAEELKEDIEYYRFSKKTGRVSRGTVIAQGKVIWGFPKIKRIFTLERGLKKNVQSNTVYLEEKIDGFNVRVASINGKIYAFSRGGFADYFASEKAREQKLEKFFSENPEKVLCGEMIGNTPYTEPTEKYDVKFLVFDVDAGDGSYLPVEEKYRLLDKYRIENVPRLGKFKSNDIRTIAKVALSLNKNKKEGVVIKSADRKEVVKYVNPEADIEDIAKCANRFFDMPSGFFDQRIMRSGIYIKDFELDHGKYAQKLGEAFYSGLRKGLKQIEREGHVSEEFEIIVKDENIWNRIVKHTGKEVKLEVVYRKAVNGKTRIRFRKIYNETSKRLRDHLNGKAVED
jgi:putative ATP-dependent DNA ligase